MTYLFACQRARHLRQPCYRPSCLRRRGRRPLSRAGVAGDLLLDVQYRRSEVRSGDPRGSEIDQKTGAPGSHSLARGPMGGNRERPHLKPDGTASEPPNRLHREASKFFKLRSLKHHSWQEPPTTADADFGTTTCGSSIYGAQRETHLLAICGLANFRRFGSPEVILPIASVGPTAKTRRRKNGAAPRSETWAPSFGHEVQLMSGRA